MTYEESCSIQHIEAVRPPWFHLSNHNQGKNRSVIHMVCERLG